MKDKNKLDEIVTHTIGTLKQVGNIGKALLEDLREGKFSKEEKELIHTAYIPVHLGYVQIAGCLADVLDTINELLAETEEE